MRVGLFGGTFNPVHLGHLKVAKEVKENFDLNKIVFIPSSIPPHKVPEGVVSAQDRFEMTRLAVSDYPDFIVSDVEVTRKGLSYTIDTILHFKSEFDENTELYLIMGIDAFLEIDTWKSFKDFFLLTPIIVMTRPGTWYGDGFSLQNALKEYIESKISKGYIFHQTCYVHPENQPIYLFETSLIDMSSTDIRDRIKNNESIKEMVPKRIKNFIQLKGLYL